MGDSESSHSRAQTGFQLPHSPTVSGLRDALLEPVEVIKDICKEETLDQSDQRILGPCKLSPTCFYGSLDAFFFSFLFLFATTRLNSSHAQELLLDTSTGKGALFMLKAFLCLGTLF